jgi:hypothetical protein
MSTYNGWTIITMPTAPSVRSIEFTQNQITGAVVSPFTGQQQLLDWQAAYAEASLELPPLTQSESGTWLAFLIACRGPMSVFQLPSILAALVPSGMAPNGYWRLKNNANKWSITLPYIYGLHFDIREAL